MAVIRDVMPAFELFQPLTVDDAMGLLGRHGAQAWVLAGGMDSLEWFADRIKRPAVVVDLSQIKELTGVRSVADGIEIGAMTTLTEVVRHPVVREKYGLLPVAAKAAASPQIRNQGTIGGNVSQDARCWYYRGGWPCYRAGGNICYADTPTGLNREHAILGADRCVAVNPSDTAPALIALDAKMVVRTPRGERVVNAEDYFIGPGIDITRMTILQPGDLLTSIRIPSTWAGAQFYFEKVRDRNVWDFALVNVASASVASGNSIERMRLVVNGVAAHPVRLKAVEAAVIGKPRNEETAEMAGKLAVQGAKPLQHNGYKVPLMRNLVKRAIRGAGGEEGSLNLIQWAQNPWGQQVPIHIAWSLLWVSAIGGLLFLIGHAIYVKFWAKPAAAHSGEHSISDSRVAARIPERVARHSLGARLFHLIMAIAMFALLLTAFLPKVGVKFAWVEYHWIAGIVLTISVIYHIIHATFVLDFWSIWPDKVDIEDASRRMKRALGEPAAAPRKFGKYPLENKLYHLVVMLAGLAVILTGVFMMKRVETPFFTRNPYLFGDMTWGWMYVLHGLAGIAFVALVTVHVYFAIRPEKLFITKSMIFGWITREQYLEHHDPERWRVTEPPPSQGQPESTRAPGLADA